VEKGRVTAGASRSSLRLDAPERGLDCVADGRTEADAGKAHVRFPRGSRQTLDQGYSKITDDRTSAIATAGTTFDNDVSAKFDLIKASWALLKTKPIPST
jgi:hypothetical protein